jgi:hypothetical protein
MRVLLMLSERPVLPDSEAPMLKRFPILAALFISFLPATVSAQFRSIDEAAFRISIQGEVVGREEFSIRQAGTGNQTQMILRGTVDLDLPEGSLRLAPILAVDGGNRGVSTYQIKVAGMETTEITVRVAGGRYLAKILSDRGEELREFRAGSGSVILDQDVAHQYFLLTPFLDETTGVSLTVLTPREGRQRRMSLTFVGEDQVPVGMQHLDARHFRLDGGGGARDVWFDEQWRILRVEIPSRGYVAEREKMD